MSMTFDSFWKLLKVIRFYKFEDNEHLEQSENRVSQDITEMINLCLRIGYLEVLTLILKAL
jgi:hypothetical protein